MSNITKKAFPVLNMHCAGCANNVEKTVKKLAGVVDASVNFATNTLSVSYEADKLTPVDVNAINTAREALSAVAAPERSVRLYLPQVMT